MATASSTMLASTDADLAPPAVQFQPPFNFMAVHDGKDSNVEFSFGTCSAPTSVESMVSRCLERDEESGPGLSSLASARAEACCLVTPPGHAILDTGCTSTLVGSENEKRWNDEPHFWW